MNIRVQSQAITKIESDVLVVPLAEGQHDNGAVDDLDAALGGALRAHLGHTGFSAKAGQSVVFPTHTQLPSRTLVLLGLGKDAADTETWRRSAAKAHAEAKSQQAKRLAWFFSEARPEADLAAVVEGSLLSAYSFDKYKSDKTPKRAGVGSLSLVGPGLRKTAALSRALAAARKTAPGVCLARDLINEPASVSTPSYLAEQATKIARSGGLKAEVFGLSRMKTAKMAGLLAVAKGSVEEPRFIKLSYTPEGRAKKKIALVGKGLTFDSGGLSLKTPKSMETMKLDMSGGATVLGAMQVIAQLRPKVQVTAYVPSTENMPSGTAQKPGDIITYKNGKTVEVLNTDAEGRLILADALIRAVEDRADVIIDLATLTGACVVALGSRVAGLFCNNQELSDALMACGKQAGEAFWPLPLVKDYRDDIKSSVADIKNIGGGSGGAIAGALFLEEFVGDTPWAHLDIAGPAFTQSALPYSPRGGTGFGVRTLVRYVMSV
ncbi:MAG: leucyl aminopeptidase [Desulfurellaceae bacterium]|nr:leucyl aminopeptidase [Desulfurellaceae bacterium]